MLETMPDSATQPLPIPGDFSWMEDGLTQYYLLDAYYAITHLDAWDWLRTAEPPEDQGFMFWSPRPSQLEAIDAVIDKGHSGTTYGFTMRAMETIAKQGWDVYVAGAND